MVNREELYEVVWSMPKVKVAEKLDVSWLWAYVANGLPSDFGSKFL